MTRLLTLGGTALAGLLFLAGCGDDRPADTPRRATVGTYRADAPPALPPVAPTTAADDDPLAVPDPLAPGGDALGDAPVPDQAPVHAEDDPLAATGRPMPTDHSHWLRGSVINARVAVSLDGVPLGEFRAPVDRDITMRLRRGVNTVTFTYTPLLPDASARLDVLESEHHPPVPPLASFRQAPVMGSMPGRPDARPVTRTDTFIAR